MEFVRIEDGTPVKMTRIAAVNYLREVLGISVRDDVEPANIAEHGVFLLEDTVPELQEYEVISTVEYVQSPEGIWRTEYTIAARDIDQYAVQLHRRIDEACGEVRKQFITDIPGQSATYTIKEEEARAYAQNPSGSYPFLEAEARSTQADIRDVALQIVNIAAQWRQLGAEIEGLRIGAKRSVSLARERGDYKSMLAATNIPWPVPKA